MSRVGLCPALRALSARGSTREAAGPSEPGLCRDFFVEKWQKHLSLAYENQELTGIDHEKLDGCVPGPMLAGRVCPAELTMLSAGASDQGRRAVPACVPGCSGDVPSFGRGPRALPAHSLWVRTGTRGSRCRARPEPSRAVCPVPALARPAPPAAGDPPGTPLSASAPRAPCDAPPAHRHGATPGGRVGGAWPAAGGQWGSQAGLSWRGGKVRGTSSSSPDSHAGFSTLCPSLLGPGGALFFPSLDAGSPRPRCLEVDRAASGRGRPTQPGAVSRRGRRRTWPGLAGRRPRCDDAAVSGVPAAGGRRQCLCFQDRPGSQVGGPRGQR